MFNKKFTENKYPYVRLKYCWDMILCLNDFIDCIGIHKKDLKCSRNIGLTDFMKDFHGKKDFNPAGVLKDYIYLEADSFFQYAKKLKSKGDKNIPELPNYFKELRNFRNQMSGHRDNDKKINFPIEWIELQENTSKLIPIKQLIKDIDNFYKEIMRKHEESQNNKL